MTDQRNTKHPVQYDNVQMSGNDFNLHGGNENNGRRRPLIECNQYKDIADLGYPPCDIQHNPGKKCNNCQERQNNCTGGYAAMKAGQEAESAQPFSPIQSSQLSQADFSQQRQQAQRRGFQGHQASQQRILTSQNSFQDLHSSRPNSQIFGYPPRSHRSSQPPISQYNSSQAPPGSHPEDVSPYLNTLSPEPNLSAMPQDSRPFGQSILAVADRFRSRGPSPPRNRCVPCEDPWAQKNLPVCDVHHKRPCSNCTLCNFPDRCHISGPREQHSTRNMFKKPLSIMKGLSFKKNSKSRKPAIRMVRCVQCEGMGMRPDVAPCNIDGSWPCNNCKRYLLDPTQCRRQTPDSQPRRDERRPTFRDTPSIISPDSREPSQDPQEPTLAALEPSREQEERTQASDESSEISLKVEIDDDDARQLTSRNNANSNNNGRVGISVDRLLQTLTNTLQNHPNAQHGWLSTLDATDAVRVVLRNTIGGMGGTMETSYVVARSTLGAYEALGAANAAKELETFREKCRVAEADIGVLARRLNEYGDTNAEGRKSLDEHVKIILSRDEAILSLQRAQGGPNDEMVEDELGDGDGDEEEIEEEAEEAELEGGTEDVLSTSQESDAEEDDDTAQLYDPVSSNGMREVIEEGYEADGDTVMS